MAALLMSAAYDGAVLWRRCAMAALHSGGPAFDGTAL
jgi:hypothetical protein